jgi:CubicO group peptidase (beta-lactamase class C family)
MLENVREHFRAEAAKLCGSGMVPGYLAGVYHRGEQIVVAAGVANIATGEAMTESTGYLAGSITKVMTATMVLQCVERGQIDLDERVIKYLPELRLAPPAKVEEIRVRHLVNHTNGIDADFLWPDRVKGPGALGFMIAALGGCSTLFEPGEYVSYSNGGILVAGRLLEVVTGQTYHDLLEREIYRPIGMVDSSTSPEQAILRRTAVGHFFDPKTRKLRRTGMFMLPETWSACGATPIVTIPDLLAFARTHLAGGVAPTGHRLLSTEWATRMRTVSVDMGTPNVSAIGLGWPLISFGKTKVLSHGGASPGGVASLMLIPEHDLAFAGFGNAGAGDLLSDQLCQWLVRDYLGLEVPDLVSGTVDPGDLTRYEGTYRSNMLRVDVKAVDGELEETMTFEPLDDGYARTFAQFSGGGFPYPPYRLAAVGQGLFAPAGIPLQALNGLNRIRMISFHGDANGRPTHHSFGGRMMRRVEG